MQLTYEFLAKRIDHSLLGPTLTDAELEEGCRLAATYRVASVCVKPHAVKLAATILDGTGVAVGTTVGFPHGANATVVKLFEAERAMDDGATELDMVVNIGWVLGETWQPVREEIGAIVEAAHARKAIVKVIFENCFLSPAAISRLCKICGEVSADYAKTSTGYGTGGAIHEDLKLMRDVAPPHVKLKAAGGIRTLNAALAVAGLGCDRIGASKTAEILDELNVRLGNKPISAGQVSRGTRDSY
ncbi:MAG: deoC1 [Planctomycetota bacterium]|nr:deoC1 [Planctomycetota bacterium]